MAAEFVIDSFQFGQMKINGKKYTNDLIILPNQIIDNWWRDKGHQLQPQDLEAIINSKAEILIIGTGANGVMKVNQKTTNYLKENDITPIIKKTTLAWKEYNQLAKKEKLIAGGFHLTC
jgi:hypothetical protein